MSIAELEDLMVEWELARQEGRELAPEDLAPGRPELIVLLRQRIGILRATTWMTDDIADNASSDVAPPPPDDRPFRDSSLTTDEFLDATVHSGVLADRQVQWLRRLVAEHEPDIAPYDLANRLVEEGALTSYQASVLLAGRNSPLVLDRYVVLDALGAGGMGLVFKALHRAMDRVVALKVLPHHALDSPAKVDRFRREIKTAARLAHPHIVAAYDAHEAEGMHFLAMEYVPGDDLRKLVAQSGPLPVVEAVTITAQIAEALREAHRLGIIHRDVKPSNILLSLDGIPKLLDLGLARIKALAQQESSNDLTREGLAMGTVAYMAPEQARDPHAVDARADIYSLGCTLYFLLVGRPLLERTSSLETILAHIEQEKPTLHDAETEIPERLEQVFQKMVAKDPDDRYRSMEDVRGALIATGLVDPDRVAESARHQARGIAASRVRPRRSLPYRMAVLAGVAVLAVGLMLAASGWLAGGTTDRDYALWALSADGLVTAETGIGRQRIARAADLPDGRFRIVRLELNDPGGSFSLDPLFQLDDLQRLRLSGFNRQSLPLERLARISTLVELGLPACQLTDTDLTLVARLDQLAHLDVSRNELTDAAAASVARLEQLEELNLAHTAVSDYALKQLAPLARLERLNLEGCLITDRGIRHLFALGKLGELWLAGTEVTASGLERFSKGRPDCVVHFDAGS